MSALEEIENEEGGEGHGRQGVARGKGVAGLLDPVIAHRRRDNQGLIDRTRVTPNFRFGLSWKQTSLAAHVVSAYSRSASTG